MGILRLLLLISIITIVLWLWKQGTYNAANKKPKILSGQMVRCAHCSIFLPKHEAIKQNNSWYCCKNHSKLTIRTKSK